LKWLLAARSRWSPRPHLVPVVAGRSMDPWIPVRPPCGHATTITCFEETSIPLHIGPYRPAICRK
jgi:hypothetical protein